MGLGVSLLAIAASCVPEEAVDDPYLLCFSGRPINGPRVSADVHYNGSNMGSLRRQDGLRPVPVRPLHPLKPAAAPAAAGPELLAGTAGSAERRARRPAAELDESSAVLRQALKGRTVPQADPLDALQRIGSSYARAHHAFLAPEDEKSAAEVELHSAAGPEVWTSWAGSAAGFSGGLSSSLGSGLSSGKGLYSGIAVPAAGLGSHEGADTFFRHYDYGQAAAAPSAYSLELFGVPTVATPAGSAATAFYAPFDLQPPTEAALASAPQPDYFEERTLQGTEDELKVLLRVKLDAESAEELTRLASLGQLAELDGAGLGLDDQLSHIVLELQNAEASADGLAIYVTTPAEAADSPAANGEEVVKVKGRLLEDKAAGQAEAEIGAAAQAEAERKAEREMELRDSSRRAESQPAAPRAEKTSASES